MTLVVNHPAGYSEERSYIFQVLLGEFLGLDFVTCEAASKEITISCPQQGSGRLMIADDLFQTNQQTWLTPDSLPRQPLPVWDSHELGPDLVLCERTVPIIYGEPSCLVDADLHHIMLDIDIFGGAFFCLSRYEELITGNRDNHQRFPAHASLASRFEFLHRPIVNEYLEILWRCLQMLWPRLERKPRKPRLLVSCDVDQPFRRTRLRGQQFNSVVGDIVLRYDPAAAWKNFWAFHRLNQDFRNDPFYTFEWMMDVCEAAGVKNAFYFICDVEHPVPDKRYTMDEPGIRYLLQRIRDRGHEVGLHTNYNSYLDKGLIQREFEALLAACDREGIQQDQFGGRQHFLRWEAPTTARLWDAAGLAYDSTLCFADHTGFRCGTCYEYPFYDLQERRVLRLRERPLIAMDTIVKAERYMNLGYSARAQEVFIELKTVCSKFNGDFALLWHNNNVVRSDAREIYQNVLNS